MSPHFCQAAIRAGHHRKDCVDAGFFRRIRVKHCRQRRFGAVSIRAGNIENFAAVIVGHGGIHRCSVVQRGFICQPAIDYHRRNQRIAAARHMFFAATGIAITAIEGKWHIR